MEPVAGQRMVIDARWVFRELSGIGRYTLELLRALGALETEREFVVLVADEERREAVLEATGLAGDERFKFVEFGYGVFSPGGQMAAGGLLRRLGAGGYHSPNYMIPLPAFPRRGRRVRCMINIHDLIPLAHPEFTPRAWKTRLYPVYRWLMREIVRRVDVVVTGSQSAKRDIIEWLKVPEERIAVIPDGVNERYVPGGEKLAAGGRKTILYVGRSDPYKNVTGLVRTLAELVRGEVDARLRIVGPPDPRYPEAGELARQLGIDERVEWAGYLDEAELVRAYQEADALALLSKYEGFGLPVLEAMACGTPVVCSRVASLPEVAGEAARLVEPEDAAGAAAALKEVLTVPAVAARMRAAGLEQAARFPWRHTAEMTLALYDGRLP
jgi:alpha-1,3-rhamnosyl/mannosyltransferase